MYHKLYCAVKKCECYLIVVMHLRAVVVYFFFSLNF